MASKKNKKPETPPQSPIFGGPVPKKTKKPETTVPVRVKAALKPFFHFTAARRADVRLENPGENKKSVNRILAAEWRGMDEAEKSVYVKMAKKDRKRFIREAASRQQQ